MNRPTDSSPDLSGCPIVAGLKRLLERHSDKRVIVVGTTCTGKSTMLSSIAGALDQDEEVFPKLSEAEADYVCQTPWTEEIGRTMTRLVRERVVVQPGAPMFGTVVIDCDFIVVLTISDALLKERVSKRNASFLDATRMQKQLKQEVLSSGILWEEYHVG